MGEGWIGSLGFYLFIYLFILAAPGLSGGMRDLQLQHADFLVAACMWDLVPPPGIEPRPPALGARSLTHWTTREVGSLGLHMQTITYRMDKQQGPTV